MCQDEAKRYNQATAAGDETRMRYADERHGWGEGVYRNVQDSAGEDDKKIPDSTGKSEKRDTRLYWGICVKGHQTRLGIRGDTGEG